MTEKTLFFAAEICANWPEEFPPGRILDEENRHMTLAFLGPCLESSIRNFPTPNFSLGLVGRMTEWVFLPNGHHPHVAAAKVDWISEHGDMNAYQKTLTAWLIEKSYLKEEKRPFFPHITVARNPTHLDLWDKFSCAIPFYVSGIILQTSLGYSQYKTLQRIPLVPPFEEIEHTADIAFIIRGLNFLDLWLHAQLALAFKFPFMLPYVKKEGKFQSLDSVVSALNSLIAQIDQEIGTPVKAVSYHAETSQKQNFIEWKMIIDV